MKTHAAKSLDNIQQKAKSTGASLAPPPLQRKSNKTGIPDQLKSGIESLSGIDMSDVRVHYNSSQPAQLQAHAYAQGNQIHIAPGQEKHLPHEAWHVVQQKQGRVKATRQLKGKVNVNDDAALEREADVLGAKANTVSAREQMKPASKGEQYASHNTSTSGTVQRTAWIKQGNHWKRKEQTKKGDNINWERATASEQAAPDPAIGESGWVFSSNRMKYFKKYSDYRNEVLLNKPSNEKGEIETTDVSNEEQFLKGKSKGLSFKKDLTHNYLLWSLPKYSGKQMLSAGGNGLKLADVSGEARGEKKSRRNKGYMMKQTLEHFEALTVLKSNLANERDLKSRVMSQHGKTINRGNPYDPKKVDALHYPRDPEYQSTLITLLKNIESFWGVRKEERKDKLNEIKESIAKAASPRLANQIAKLMRIHQGDRKRKEGTPKESSRDRAFNKEFYGQGFPNRLMQSIKAKRNSAGPDPFGAIGRRDDKDEVTRAPLAETTKGNQKGGGELIGGRNAVFETIWGPKSSEVVDKAARRHDAVVSHGLKYHFSPANTVQAKYEFPPYRALVEKLLKDVCTAGQEKKYYDNAIKALDIIITEINSLSTMDPNKSWESQGKDRTAKINEIYKQNNILVIAMTNLRQLLAK